jgi:hypothetical protein
MDRMDRQHSDYRGWTLWVATDERRKSLGHAVRRDRPHEVITSEGWGEKLVLDELRRLIDAIEDGDSDVDPSPAA